MLIWRLICEEIRLRAGDDNNRGYVSKIAYDCRHFRSDRPCVFKQKCRCEYYDSMGFRVVIIKLGALGDVVRTTCLLDTIKREYSNSHITWVTSSEAKDLLKNDVRIDRLVTFDVWGIVELTNQKFDLVLSLDKEGSAAGLCNMLDSEDKRGICLSQWGTSMPCNKECEEYFELGLDDEKKFYLNDKSYPELIHEALGLQYIRQPYRLYCDESVLDWAKSKFEDWSGRSEGVFVGLNTGAGSVFANKSLSRWQWKELIGLLNDRGYSVVLLGGENEREKNEWLMRESRGIVFDADCAESLERFVAIVSQCDVVVSGDTLGLHVAIGRDVPVVALFGPTCHQEIDLFDRGIKLISGAECCPCYKRRCERVPNCMDMISVEEIADSVSSLVRVPAEIGT